MVGGAERVFSHLLHGFRRDPYEVELLALREPGPIGEEIAESGVTVHSRLTGSGTLDPLLPLRLHRLLRRGRYDAIYFLDHAHAVFYTTMASLGTSVRVRLMPVHTTGQWNGQPSLKRPIRLVQSKLDRIISIAEAQRRYLVQEEGLPASQIEVIPNGIPVEAPTLEARATARREVRAALGVSEDAPVVGITAVLRPEKNHELLLGAFARLRARVPKAELWIVGDGPRRAALQAQIDERGLHDSVRMLGHRSDARRLMSGFDVAVLSSHPRVETLPLSLMEAMDAGVPVVATRVGALAEMIEDRRSGVLVDPGDEDALAEALAWVLEEDGRRLALGTRAQAIASERYSVETMVSATERLLRSLLERAG